MQSRVAGMTYNITGVHGASIDVEVSKRFVSWQLGVDCGVSTVAATADGRHVTRAR